MPCHILRNSAGEIAFWDTQPFHGSIQVDYEVVRGYDSKLYKAGEEPKGPTIEEQLLLQLRAKRDELLTGTDKYLIADYPISPEELEAIKVYRQALRDLPAQPGAPWDGGGYETPWPDALVAGDKNSRAVDS